MHLPATLSIVPNRTQFFLYDKISLKCTMPASPNGWSMWRNASATESDTFHIQRVASNASYDISHAYPSDSGVYWCESPRGECSNRAHLTVTGNGNVSILLCGCSKPSLTVLCAVSAGTVILESPLCVSKGDPVTLRCLLKNGTDETAASDFTFFKNEVSMGSAQNGRMDLPAVSQSDEGFYRCKHPKGDSPNSFLAIAGNWTVSTKPVLNEGVLFIVVATKF